MVQDNLIEPKRRPGAARTGSTASDVNGFAMAVHESDLFHVERYITWPRLLAGGKNVCETERVCKQQAKAWPHKTKVPRADEMSS